MSESREEIVDALRGRILRGIEAGTLKGGSRLPSGRDLASEFGSDHRVVLAAYRELAAEGLVEMTPRGGIYVTARHGATEGIPPLPESWLADVLTQGLQREIPAPELHDWLRRCTETLRIRAAVIAATSDQRDGLCRELRDDFGLEAEAVAPEELGAAPPLALRRAAVLISTQSLAARVNQLGTALSKPIIIVDVRPDLITGEWAILLRHPVYAVVATKEFGEILRNFFVAVPGIENLRIIVLGVDDLSTIPPDAPTYITQRVRAHLNGITVPGRILPAARTISTQSAREIFAFIVRANVESLGRRGA